MITILLSLTFSPLSLTVFACLFLLLSPYGSYGLYRASVSVQADSHIACRAHVVPLPCRAAKGLGCVFPIWFTQCGRVWFTLAMPRPSHPRPFPSSQGHSTARPSRAGVWATWVRLLPVTTRSSTKFLSDAYQSQMQVDSVKPNTVYHGRGKEW